MSSNTLKTSAPISITHGSLRQTNSSTAFTNSQNIDYCAQCGKKVYPLESIKANRLIFHKACFRCETCKTVLNSRTSNPHRTPTGKTVFYCPTHIPKEKSVTALDNFENNKEKPIGSPSKTTIPQRNSTDGMLPTFEKRSSGSLRVIKKTDSDLQPKTVFRHSRNASIDSPPRARALSASDGKKKGTAIVRERSLTFETLETIRKTEIEIPSEGDSPFKPKQNISPKEEKKNLKEEILTWVKTEDSLHVYTRLVESIRSDIEEKTHKHSPPRTAKTEELIAFLKSIQLEFLANTLIHSLGADSMESLRFLKENDLKDVKPLQARKLLAEVRNYFEKKSPIQDPFEIWKTYRSYLKSWIETRDLKFMEKAVEFWRERDREEMRQNGAKMEKELLDEITSDLDDFPADKVTPAACSIKGKNLRLLLERIDVSTQWNFVVNFVCENSEWRIKGEGKEKKDLKVRFADPPEDSSTSEGESIRGLGDDPGVRVSLNQLGILMDFSTKKTKAFADENFDDCY